MHELDCELRATREDRICVRESASGTELEIPGVVAQTADTEAEKQIRDVITLPISVPPNVCAAREADLNKAMR